MAIITKIVYLRLQRLYRESFMFKYPQNFSGFNSLIVLKKFFFGMFLYLGEVIYFMFRAEKVRS